jgi:hypothetical protein
MQLAGAALVLVLALKGLAALLGLEKGRMGLILVLRLQLTKQQLLTRLTRILIGVRPSAFQV